MRSRHGRPGAAAPGVRIAPVLAPALAVILSGVGPAWNLGAETPPDEAVPRAAAMSGTEDYCVGYGTTFHGEWNAGGAAASGPPTPFRIGVNAGGAACYAQLGVMSSTRVAPHEVPRFRVRSRGGDTWSLRYRDFALDLDANSGSVVRRRGAEPPWTGVLLSGPPPLGAALPAPPGEQRKRWYGKWRGRLSGIPFRVTLRFAPSGAGEVRGRISSLLMNESFTGRFHGEMLVFRWRNRHVGLVMEPGGDELVYNDYKSRVFRFRRAR